MHKVKWLFFGYLGACLLTAVAIAVSFAVTRSRDPDTNYGTYAGNLKSLDPAEIGDAGANDLAGYVYEALYNYAFREDAYRLIPQLADGQPAVSDDGTVVTIKVKPGVHFYDPTGRVFPDGRGPEVTAEDFIYSWKRVCNFQLGFTSNYGNVFQGRVAGIDDWFKYTEACGTPDKIDWARPVEGLTAIDRYTIRIKLVRPFPQLQFTLAMLPTAPVARAAVERWGEDFKFKPTGTGPYAMSEHLPDQRITYTANPLYRGGPEVYTGQAVADADRLPRVKRVQLSAFTESLPPWYLFLQGQLDASGIPKDTFGSAIDTTGGLTQEMQADGIKLNKVAQPWTTYLVFNMSDPVLGKNKPLRQAMSLAFDRERYIELYLNGRGVPANGPIPPGFPTFDAKREAPYGRFDLAAAKAKVKEAEEINGGPIPPLRLLFGNTDTNTVQTADFIVTSMRQIGLTVLTEYKPYGQFLAAVDRNQFQIHALGWVADYPEELNFLQLFYGRNIGAGGLNSCRYKNPAFDALYEKAAVLSAGPERTALYLKMQAMLLEDCPMSWNVYPVKFDLYHDWQSPPWGSVYGYGYKQYLTLDTAARDRWLNKQ